MDVKQLESSSEDSLGSEEEDSPYNLNPRSEGKLVDSDSLLDSSDSDTDPEEDVENLDEMEVDEDALNADLSQVNEQLAANPYSYELYVEKIKILKRVGDLGKLRAAREKFSELYPLSEQLWLEWLRDEIKIAFTEEEKNTVVDLFERAIADYLSVDIWLEFINFCVSRMEEEDGLARCRDVFERALGSCGLHASMGLVIWDMYRDFEAALLGTAGTEEQLQTQEARYLSLCRRQLSVPLLGIGNTYEDLKSKIEIDENTENSYKNAMKRLSTLEIWESKLVQPSVDKIKIYREYIDDEKKTKCNPARIQCLYERAIADSPLDSLLWLEYLEYLIKNLKIETILLDVAQRASRNCSWDLSIWLKYMNVIETFCDTKVTETMKSAFEKAVMYCGSTGEMAGTLWLKYVEFLRRKLDTKSPDEKQLEILRKTFTAAEQHLLQLLPEPNEYICEILLFRLRLEAHLSKSINNEISDMWKDLLSRGYGQFAKTWIQFIFQEAMYGCDIKKIRSHYSKAIAYVQDDLQIVSNLWINFERDNGDLPSLQQCEAKISAQMAKNATFLAARTEEVVADVRGNSAPNKAQKGTKRKLGRGEDDVPSNSPKKGKRTEDTVDSENSNSVFKVPTMPAPISKKVNQNNEAKPAKTPSSHGEFIKHDPSKDNRTIFLSNLAFTTGENEITAFFTDIGKINEVRLAKDYRGRSKGFGYVCFSSVNEARSALGKDRQPISGRPVFVSKCDPDKTTRQKQFKYSTNLEKNKLFVKGLPFSLTADELRDIFKIHGDIKDCRLVTHRNGHSKGLAYVEFVDESCAQQAILKVDGMTVQDKQISVALSNPPSRDSSTPKSSFRTGNVASNPSDMQRRAPKAFVPRSLQISSVKKATGETNSGQTGSQAPKSNDDFRKMFLK